ncbi:MAG: prepilin-type N-terminal cleavage/methylation domain-containing protein [Alphaproteobacteria bacterium]|nr:prepilin-type N-terminal cleavage/methylation domain-containing protein [Alphaproteobacteria bacterium]
MTLSAIQARPSEKGFTLVELAIVMIIIGLLIGGILKGQELINNSRVTATVSQAKAVEAGISSFRDKYAGFPGDLLAPVTRIAGCGTLCATAGNANGQITGATAGDPGAANGAANEQSASFVQLGAAGMIGGVIPNTVVADINRPGVSNPVIPIGGAWQLAYSNGNGTFNVSGAATLETGHYIVSLIAPGTAAALANIPFTAAQAENIDRKLDDGNAITGTTRALGTAGAVGATNCATAAGVYNSADGTPNCGVYVKVQ